MKEATMTEALHNLGDVIDEAIKKIHIWEDRPDETRTALNELKVTRKHLRTYLRTRGRDQRSHNLSMITEVVVERARRQNQLPKSRTLTQEEQQRLLAELERSTDQRLRLIVLLILFTGIRPAEARSLTWRDIDTEHMRLTIHRSARYGPNNTDPLRTATRHRGAPLMVPSNIRER